VVEAVTVRVEASAPDPELPGFAAPTAGGASYLTKVFGDGAWREARVQARDAVSELQGPAIVTEYSSTTWVPEGWTITRQTSGALLMSRT
jgi:N-methylhydantoinase A/oxoprolinase/acetone carboxylase beta subunit